MKSPFPGMDPYLEKHWLDVHHRLATYACDQLQRKLPRDLRARIEERVFVEFDDLGQYRGIHPDVRVIEHPRPDTVAQPPEGGVATAEPIVVQTADDPISQGYVEIVDASSGNRVVTVIEFVSPSNKVPGEGRDLYLRKQREVIRAKASLVEVDLTRAGQRCLAAKMTQIPPQYHATYMACVTRGWKWGSSEVYSLPLHESLPAIRIPLRQTDPDVSLDLQALIDQCYENGGYDTIEYHEPVQPPLEPADAAWAKEWLRSKGIG
jgi:hypothetical protein